MSWEPDSHQVSDDELAQRELTRDLLDDDESRRGWRRRAVGMSRQQAFALVPRIGQLQCTMPIDGWRALHLHLEARGANAAQWMRAAIIERYLAEGGDPTLAEAMAAVRPERRRDTHLPDRAGQSRWRTGRGGRGRYDDRG